MQKLTQKPFKIRKYLVAAFLTQLVLFLTPSDGGIPKPHYAAHRLAYPEILFDVAPHRAAHFAYPQELSSASSTNKTDGLKTTCDLCECSDDDHTAYETHEKNLQKNSPIFVKARSIIDTYNSVLKDLKIKRPIKLSGSLKNLAEITPQFCNSTCISTLQKIFTEYLENMKTGPGCTYTKAEKDGIRAKIQQSDSKLWENIIKKDFARQMYQMNGGSVGNRREEGPCICLSDETNVAKKFKIKNKPIPDFLWISDKDTKELRKKFKKESKAVIGAAAFKSGDLPGLIKYILADYINKKPPEVRKQIEGKYRLTEEGSGDENTMPLASYARYLHPLVLCNGLLDLILGGNFLSSASATASASTLLYLFYQAGFPEVTQLILGFYGLTAFDKLLNYLVFPGSEGGLISNYALAPFSALSLMYKTCVGALSYMYNLYTSAISFGYKTLNTLYKSIKWLLGGVNGLFKKLSRSFVKMADNGCTRISGILGCKSSTESESDNTWPFKVKKTILRTNTWISKNILKPTIKYLTDEASSNQKNEPPLEASISACDEKEGAEYSTGIVAKTLNTFHKAIKWLLGGVNGLFKKLSRSFVKMADNGCTRISGILGCESSTESESDNKWLFRVKKTILRTNTWISKNILKPTIKYLTDEASSNQKNEPPLEASISACDEKEGAEYSTGIMAKTLNTFHKAIKWLPVNGWKMVNSLFKKLFTERTNAKTEKSEPEPKKPVKITEESKTLLPSDIKNRRGTIDLINSDPSIRNEISTYFEDLLSEYDKSVNLFTEDSFAEKFIDYLFPEFMCYAFPNRFSLPNKERVKDFASIGVKPYSPFISMFANIGYYAKSILSIPGKSLNSDALEIMNRPITQILALPATIFRTVRNGILRAAENHEILKWMLNWATNPVTCAAMAFSYNKAEFKNGLEHLCYLFNMFNQDPSKCNCIEAWSPSLFYRAFISTFATGIPLLGMHYLHKCVDYLSEEHNEKRFYFAPKDEHVENPRGPRTYLGTCASYAWSLASLIWKAPSQIVYSIYKICDPRVFNTLGYAYITYYGYKHLTGITNTEMLSTLPNSVLTFGAYMLCAALLDKSCGWLLGDYHRSPTIELMDKYLAETDCIVKDFEESSKRIAEEAVRRAPAKAVKKAENDKKIAEEAVKKAEEAAKKAENDKKIAEEAVKKAEEAAKKAENDKKIAEEAAQKAESDKKSAEEAAKKADEAAQKAKESAEEAAQKAENAKKSAEGAAQKAESDKKSAEEAAKKAQKPAKKAAQKAKESAKKAAQKAKESAEEAVKKAEKAKKSADEAAQKAEAVKRAENDKKAAEEAVKKAEEAVKKAENDKKAAEEAVKKAEKAKKSAEEAVKKAEKAKKSADEAVKKAEEAVKKAENDKKAAEEAIKKG